MLVKCYEYLHPFVRIFLIKMFFFIMIVIEIFLNKLQVQPNQQTNEHGVANF
jgi:hypothetical protein